MATGSFVTQNYSRSQSEVPRDLHRLDEIIAVNYTQCHVFDVLKRLKQSRSDSVFAARHAQHGVVERLTTETARTHAQMS
ncbi:hypothetical protein TNCV_249301 [Trichonephila clavipes]|nr:hypothetical protein TNCV_249301 [Trichonephila clavipes]